MTRESKKKHVQNDVAHYDLTLTCARSQLQLNITTLWLHVGSKCYLEHKRKSERELGELGNNESSLFQNLESFIKP